MQIIRSLPLIFNFNSIIIALLAVLSTYICIQYELYANFPLALIGIAIVFPIVFSINSAYQRRERALNHYGNIKSHGRAMYFASRDWVPKTDKKFQTKIKRILYELLYSCRIMFNTGHSDDEYRETVVYTKFSDLSLYVEECRARDMSGSEISRMNQYISKMMIAFENMKHIYQYRTPITLRAYSKVFIFGLPILYGPYFAHISLNYPPIMFFIMPVLFSLVLVSLDNIQDQLENPYDLIGEDDVQMHVEKYIKELDL